MLILLGAMGNEIKGLKSKMVIEETLSGNNYRIYKGNYEKKDILLGQTGIGKENAELCLEFILKRYHVTAIISIGFSGALAESLHVGDVVLSKTLYSGDNQIENNTEIQNPVYSDERLISIALQAQGETIELPQFSSITTKKTVGNPKEKLILGNKYSAEIVDMESYWIARMASDKNIPFLSIRAISDTVKEILPPFDKFLVDGQWRVKKAILYFLASPHEFGRLLYLYMNTRQAVKNLTAFTDSFITRYEAN